MQQILDKLNKYFNDRSHLKNSGKLIDDLPLTYKDLYVISTVYEERLKVIRWMKWLKRGFE